MSGPVVPGQRVQVRGQPGVVDYLIPGPWFRTTYNRRRRSPGWVVVRLDGGGQLTVRYDELEDP